LIFFKIFRLNSILVALSLFHSFDAFIRCTPFGTIFASSYANHARAKIAPICPLAAGRPGQWFIIAVSNLISPNK